MLVSPFTTDYLCGSAARRPRDHPHSLSLLIMTHLRAAGVSDRRRLNGSSRRHRRGSEAINRDIERRQAVWILTCDDDDKRALRVGTGRRRRV